MVGSPGVVKGNGPPGLIGLTEIGKRKICNEDGKKPSVVAHSPGRHRSAVILSTTVLGSGVFCLASFSFPSPAVGAGAGAGALFFLNSDARIPSHRRGNLATDRLGRFSIGRRE